MLPSADLLTTPNRRSQVSGIRAFVPLVLAALCFAGGVWNCWRFCYAPDTDEINYLDIGEAFFRGDSHHFLNSMWGPLFGVLSELWLRVMPAGYAREELKVLNLCILLLVLWGALGLSKRIVDSQGGSQGGRQSFAAFAISEFFVFSVLWVCLSIMGVFRETPDLLLTAIVLASSLCYLGLFDGAGRVDYRRVLAVGALGAAGYYLKQAYLPIAILFLIVLAWAPAVPRIRVLRVALASAAFGLLILPWVASLSAAEGHLTLGGNSKFNYFVNVLHSDTITPLFEILPAQDRLPSDRSVVDFGATYPNAQFPLHFEGTYYLTDVPIEFNWKRQLHQSLTNYVITLNLFRHKGPFAIVLVLAIVAGLCLRKLSLWDPWLPLIAIAAAPFILYPLVHVEYRYLAPYLFLGAISAWAWVTSQNVNISRSWALILGCCLAIGMLWDTAADLRDARRDDAGVSFACCTNPYEGFRAGLHAAGVREGAKIALVGEPEAPHFYAWLNPGHYRLQAVVTDPARFFAESAAVRDQTERELSDRGSQVLIAPGALVPRDQSGDWRELSLGFVYHRLGQP